MKQKWKRYDGSVINITENDLPFSHGSLSFHASQIIYHSVLYVVTHHHHVLQVVCVQSCETHYTGRMINDHLTHYGYQHL